MSEDPTGAPAAPPASGEQAPAAQATPMDTSNPPNAQPGQVAPPPATTETEQPPQQPPPPQQAPPQQQPAAAPMTMPAGQAPPAAQVPPASAAAPPVSGTAPQAPVVQVPAGDDSLAAAHEDLNSPINTPGQAQQPPQQAPPQQQHQVQPMQMQPGQQPGQPGPVGQVQHPGQPGQAPQHMPPSQMHPQMQHPGQVMQGAPGQQPQAIHPGQHPGMDQTQAPQGQPPQQQQQPQGQGQPTQQGGMPQPQQGGQPQQQTGQQPQPQQPGMGQQPPPQQQMQPPQHGQYAPPPHHQQGMPQGMPPQHQQPGQQPYGHPHQGAPQQPHDQRGWGQQPQLYQQPPQGGHHDQYQQQGYNQYPQHYQQQAPPHGQQPAYNQQPMPMHPQQYQQGQPGMPAPPNHQGPPPQQYQQMHHQPMQQQQQPQQQQPQQQPPQPQQQQPQQQQGQPGQPQEPGRQLKVEDALAYLEQVKYEYSNRPAVYNQFLEIMKEFKAQTIDTPGVIARVSQLFEGNHHLILGFNTFLPPGYKITLDESDPTMAPRLGIMHSAPPNGHGQPPQYLPQGGMIQPLPIAQNNLIPQHQPQPQPTQGGGKRGRGGKNAGGQAAAGAESKAPIDFDHAINYVTEIKTRFHHEPHVYRKFLDILKTYQKEQQSIDQVYSQVAALFRNHPDLLREFTKFLPDAKSAAGAQKKKEKDAKNAKRRRTDKGGKDDDRKGKKGRGKAVPEPPVEEIFTGPSLGLHFWEQVKNYLATGERYGDFLKCLNLYSQEAISRAELLMLVDDFLADVPELNDEFKQFLSRVKHDSIRFDAARHAAAAAAGTHGPSGQGVEFSSSFTKQYGPSYHAMPHQRTYASGRSALCEEVLNDFWVSMPTGSEDFTTRSLRKNQFEESLFRCEDDRYELDMVIEQNVATLRLLEPIARQVASKTPEEAARMRFDLRLSALNEKSIERLYSERTGEILTRLKKRPALSVPVVVRRLKQKDQEWRAVRRDFNKIWRDVNEKNYQRSLDHQSIYFKQQDKKVLNPKAMVTEITDLHRKAVDAAEGPNPPTTTHHLEHGFANQEVFTDVRRLVLKLGEAQYSESDRVKLVAFWDRFMALVFDSRKARPLPEASANTENSAEGSNANGDAMEVEGPPASKTPKKQAATHSIAFVGNNHMYIMFRLLQLLYERLEAARRMSRKPRFNADSVSKKSDTLKNSDAPNGEHNESRPLTQETPDALYAKYIQLLEGFVDGRVNQQTYEDDCRSIFGTTSYVLFTMDKLCTLLLKQLQTVVNDEASASLLTLFVSTQPASEGASPQLSTAKYNAHCRALLREENRFRFEVLFPTLRLQTTLEPPPTTGMYEEWSEYVQDYMSSDVAADIDPMDLKLFLFRCLKSRMPQPEEGAETQVAAKPAVDGMVIRDGLACKVCVSSFQLFYVEDTEDFLYRPGAQQAAMQSVTAPGNEKRSARFHAWLDKRLADGAADAANREAEEGEGNAAAPAESEGASGAADAAGTSEADGAGNGDGEAGAAAGGDGDAAAGGDAMDVEATA